MIRIWYFSIMVLAVFILGCRFPDVITNDYTQANLEEQFSLDFGKSAIVSPADIIVKFLKVTEDSRCPSDVVCIWAGQVSVSINVNDHGRKLGNIKLTLGANKEDSVKAVGDYYIKLIDVKPYPISTKQIKPSEYIVTLIVSEFKD